MEEEDFYEDLLRKNLTIGYIKRIEEAVPIDKLIKIRTNYLMNCLSNFAKTDGSSGANGNSGLTNGNQSGKVLLEKNKEIEAEVGPENNRESDEESENDNDGLDLDSDRVSLPAKDAYKIFSDSEPDESINESLNGEGLSSKRLCKSKPTSKKDIPVEVKIEIDSNPINENEEQVTEEIVHNPTSNAVIMQLIFKYLPAADLLRFRTVSSDWDNQIISHLDRNNILQYLNIKENNIEKIISLVKSSKIIPFTKFDLSDRGKKYENDRSVQSLFTVCGTLVRHLTVEILHFVKELRQCLPNLESLHLVEKRDQNDDWISHDKRETWSSILADDYSSGDEGDDNKNVDDRSHAHEVQSALLSKLKDIKFTVLDDWYFMEVSEYAALFQDMPSLNRLEVRLNGPNDYIEEFPIEVVIVEALKNAGALGKITKLYLDTLGKSTFEILCHAASVQALCLDEFCVDRIDDHWLLNDVFYDFLSGQGKSLKKLEVRTTFRTPTPQRTGNYAPCSGPWREPITDNDSYNLRLKNMEALTSLTIHVVNYKFFPKKCNSLKDLPNLVRVNIPNIFSDMAESLSKEFSHNGVTELSVNLNRSKVEIQRKKAFCSQNVITYLGIIFPSVKSLKLNDPSHEDMQTVVQVWLKLKHLKLELNRAYYQKTFIKDITSLEDMQKFFPSLLEMKDLETLSIYEFDWKSKAVKPRLFTRFEKIIPTSN